MQEIVDEFPWNSIRWGLYLFRLLTECFEVDLLQARKKFRAFLSMVIQVRRYYVCGAMRMIAFPVMQKYFQCELRYLIVVRCPWLGRSTLDCSSRISRSGSCSECSCRQASRSHLEEPSPNIILVVNSIIGPSWIKVNKFAYRCWKLGIYIIQINK